MNKRNKNLTFRKKYQKISNNQARKMFKKFFLRKERNKYWMKKIVFKKFKIL